jgi:hypothetical protein
MKKQEDMAADICNVIAGRIVKGFVSGEQVHVDDLVIWMLENYDIKERADSLTDRLG